MAKLKNLIFGTSAAIATIAPVAIAASCGDEVEALNANQIDVNGKLAQSASLIEQDYQELLLSKINPSFDNSSYETIFNSTIKTGETEKPVSELIKYFINQNIYQDSNYLKTFGQALLSYSKERLIIDSVTNSAPVAGSDQTYAKITYADLNRYHLLDEVPPSGVPWIAQPEQSALFDELAKLMLKSNLLTFKNKFYRFLISYNYLDTTKTEWDSVYHKSASDQNYREYTPVDTYIDENGFLLTKEVIAAKPFLTWQVTLDEERSREYIGQAPATRAEIDQVMTGWVEGNNDLLPFSQRNKRIADFNKDITSPLGLAVNISNLPNYTGVVQRSAVGSKSLSFTVNELQKVTDIASYNEAYNGYVQDNQLKTTEIEYFNNNATTVSLTRVIGIMPIYNAQSRFSVNHFDAGQLKEIIFFLNAADVYDDAITYYTNKEDPIMLVITDDYVRTLAIDNFGFSFVKEPDNN